MLLLLIFFAYILLAKYLSCSNKGIWINTVSYIQETSDSSEVIVDVNIFILFLLFPIVILQSECIKLKNLFILRDKVCSKNISSFIKEYYPEVSQNLRRTTVILQGKYIISFLSKVMLLFERKIEEQEYLNYEKNINRLIAGEKERFIFYLNSEDEVCTLVIEIKCNEKYSDTYMVMVYAKDFLLKKIDDIIIEFCLKHEG